MELYELRRLYDYYLNTHTHTRTATLALRNGLCVCLCGMSIIKYEHICCSLFYSAFHWQKINKNNAKIRCQPPPNGPRGRGRGIPFCLPYLSADMAQARAFAACIVYNSGESSKSVDELSFVSQIFIAHRGTSTNLTALATPATRT